jgi:two-component system, cell cycle response regulator DivK
MSQSFIVVAPRRPTTSSGRSRSAARRDVRTTKAAPLILIVDDVDDNRALYAEYLTHHGLRVDEAVDGEEALEKIERVLPDLVVMDLSMPRLDGWEATRRIKANAEWRHIPVLVVTGHAIGSEVRRAREAGCDALCTKPCLPQQLLMHVRELLAATERH